MRDLGGMATVGAGDAITMMSEACVETGSGVYAANQRMLLTIRLANESTVKIS
jgi:hypothetical protein